MLGGLGHTGHQSWPPMDRWIGWESWPPYAEAPTESQGKSQGGKPELRLTSSAPDQLLILMRAN